MIETKKGDSAKIQQKFPPSQNQIKDQILQNLNKSSTLSHNHTSPALPELNIKSQNQATLANPFYQNSERNQNDQKMESARKQFQEPKVEDNEFMNEEEINHKILLNGYFSELGKQIIRKKTQSVAKNYSNKIQECVQSGIKQGDVRISKHQQEIQNLLDDFKPSSEELKILEKRTQMQIKQQKIMLLDPFHSMRKQKHTQRQSQNSSLENTILNNYVTSAVLSKEEHKKLIQKFNLSHKQNQQKKRQRLFEIQEQERSLSHQKSIIEAQRIKKQKQFRRLSIEQKLVKRKKMHESFILQEKVSTQKYMEMKKKKFLYENMEEKYKSEVLIPSLEEKKIKLKQIRDFHKKYDIQEIKKHEQEYLQKKSEESSKNNSRHKITTLHYNPPARSKRLEQLLEEERYRAKIKFQEKKRIAEENKIKQINFLSQIKIKYKPKIDETKREEIEKRLKSEEAKNQKSVEKDLKLLGMKHFEEARKFIKKPKVKQKTEVQYMKQPQHKTERERIKTKQKTEGNDFYEKQDEQNEFLKVKISRKQSMIRPEKRINISLSQNLNHNKINLHEQKRKEIKKIINSNELERAIKLQRLKIQNERISQIYKRKQRFFRQNEDDLKNREEAIELLLNSIQAKMGIIDLCTKG